MQQAATGEQLYFGLLRSHDPASPPVHQAALQARRFADLASRCLAALGEESATQISLAAPALAALLEDGDTGRFEHVLQLSMDSALLARFGPFLLGLFVWQKPNSVTPALGLGGPVQVWLAEGPGGAPALYAPLATTPPPAPFRLASEPPAADWLRFCRPRPAHILAHYDGHGVTMAALSQRYLQELDLPCDVAISFEWTGDIGKLWKRAVPRAISSAEDYSAIIMVDCPVHSRRPEYTLKALSRMEDHADRRLILIDHHSDTIDLAPQLAGLPGVQVVLTDIPGCGLLGPLDAESEALMFTGALSDKLPGLPDAVGRRRGLEATATALHRWCLKFSPTPPELKAEAAYPFAPVIRALADGAACSTQTLERYLGQLPEDIEQPAPEYLKAGAVAVVTSRLNQPGRAWYGTLERVMAEAGTSYAVAARLLNGHRANLLLLTHWEDIHVPPIRSFIAADYLPHCLGHATAVWIDLEVRHAAVFLTRVIDNANAYFAQAVDARPAVEAVQQNIYEAPPVQAEPPETVED